MRKTILVLQPAPALDVPPPPPTPTNEALIARIEEGDGVALHELFRRHADLLRGVISRFVSKEDECEDVLRETFEAIRDRAVHYSYELGNALGWMITNARRCAINRAQALAAEPAVTQEWFAARAAENQKAATSERGFRFQDLFESAA